MDPHRARKLSEALREELEEIIHFEMEDPRVDGVAVSHVEAAGDLRNAHVRVTVPEGDERGRRALQALDHASPFLRRELAGRLNLRRAPQLHFSADRWSAAPERVETLLARARKTRVRE